MSLDLTRDDIQQIKDLLDRGERLPDRYRASLFADASATELIWPGKTNRVETAVLPFQSIEHVDEPRQETEGLMSLFDMDSGTGRQVGGWTNKLVWGDNRLILSSLVNGPLRQQIEDAGGLKLVYIDPPFDVGTDFSMDIEVGDETVTKKPSVIEEIAYRDTWGEAGERYPSFISERIRLLHDLLAPDGVMVVHVDWRVSYIVRCVLNEVFGTNRLVNEIIWHYDYGARPKTSFGKKHDNLFVFSKSDRWTFNASDVLVPYESGMTEWRYTRGGQAGKEMPKGKVPSDVWDIKLNAMSHEHLGYPTQKPEALIERIIRGFSNEGDLVADVFVGSGTTAVVAEKFGRKWIAADLGRFAIHTTRKRLVGTQRELKSEGKPYRAFEVLNLGSYERQHFVGVDVNLSQEEQERQARDREDAYLSLILRAYAGERASGAPPFHGVKGGTAVLVGPIDAPVTEQQVRDAIRAAVAAGITRVDVLGFEFEMGLKPLLQDEARDQGVNLALRYIPNDVFDKRAIQKGDVKFHDVAYVEFKPSVTGHRVTVALQDFVVFYRQQDADAAAAGLRTGGSRVVVDEGQVVKVSKDKKGILSRELLTSKWTDWIDYWAVDFDYMSQPEVIRVVERGEEKQVKTGRFIFENRWQSFRTKQDRDLELVSAPHDFPGPGTYKVAVKVIDIFGNDTTRVVPVRVRS